MRSAAGYVQEGKVNPKAFQQVRGLNLQVKAFNLHVRGLNLHVKAFNLEVKGSDLQVRPFLALAESF
jgi:hypothetical protein